MDPRAERLLRRLYENLPPALRKPSVEALWDEISREFVGLSDIGKIRLYAAKHNISLAPEAQEELEGIVVGYAVIPPSQTQMITIANEQTVERVSSGYTNLYGLRPKLFDGMRVGVARSASGSAFIPRGAKVELKPLNLNYKQSLESRVVALASVPDKTPFISKATIVDVPTTQLIREIERRDGTAFEVVGITLAMDDGVDMYYGDMVQDSFMAFALGTGMLDNPANISEALLPRVKEYLVGKQFYVIGITRTQQDRFRYRIEGLVPL